MTVQELIEQLLDCDLDAEVVIPATYTYYTVGSSPCAQIRGAQKGFDWDRGKVFIRPTTNLVQLNSYQYNEFRKCLSEHDWIRHDIHYGKKPRGTIPPMFNPTPPEESKKD
jgi:hypothetical protein